MRAIDLEFELNGGVDFFKIQTPDPKQMRIIKFSVNPNELTSTTEESIVEFIRSEATRLADGSQIYTYAITPSKGKLEVFIEVAKVSEYGPTER